jgi:hypothetical protein
MYKWNYIPTIEMYDQSLMALVERRDLNGISDWLYEMNDFKQIILFNQIIRIANYLKKPNAKHTKTTLLGWSMFEKQFEHETNISNEQFEERKKTFECVYKIMKENQELTKMLTMIRTVNKSCPNLASSNTFIDLHQMLLLNNEYKQASTLLQSMVTFGNLISPTLYSNLIQQLEISNVQPQLQHDILTNTSTDAIEAELIRAKECELMHFIYSNTSEYVCDVRGLSVEDAQAVIILATKYAQRQAKQPDCKLKYITMTLICTW